MLGFRKINILMIVYLRALIIDTKKWSWLIGFIILSANTVFGIRISPSKLMLTKD